MKIILGTIVGVVVFAILWDLCPTLRAKLFGWKIGAWGIAKAEYGDNYETKLFRSRITGTLVPAYRKKR